MDIKNSIIQPEVFGCHEGKQLALEIANSPNTVKVLITDFLAGDARFRQRASWVLVELAQNYQDSLLPYLKKLMKALINKPDDSVKRNILRIFQFLDIPKRMHEKLINYCFDVLVDKEQAIAIQVFAMTVLKDIILEYPELEKELILILEEKLPYASAGYQSRARKILNEYHKKGD